MLNGHRHNRILLVEDNASNRDLAKMVLLGSGFDVDIAVDGEEGLHKVRSKVYDLVLMDVELPGMDGLTLTRMLKADPKTVRRTGGRPHRECDEGQRTGSTRGRLLRLHHQTN